MLPRATVVMRECDAIPRAGLGASALIGVLGGVLVLWAANAFQFPDLWALSLTSIALALAPILVEWRKRKLDLMNIRNAFLIVYLLEYGVWSAYILATGRTQFESIDPRHNHDHFLLALVYSILGLASFYLGYYIRLQKLKSHWQIPIREWNRKSVTLLSLACLLGGILAFGLLMQLSGGFYTYVSSLQSSRVLALVGRQYFASASTILISLAASVSYAGSIHLKSRTLRAIAIFSVPVMVLSGLLIGYRNLVVLGVLQLLVIHHYLKRPIRLRVRTVCIAVLMVAFLNFYSELRTRQDFWIRPSFQEIYDILFSPYFWNDSVYRFLNRFHGIESLVIVTDQVREGVPLEWGLSSAWEIITSPIPRLWWTDKPVAGSYRFTQTFFFSQEWWVLRESGGIAPSWLGELFWNFHVPGILFGSFLGGFLCSICYQFLRENSKNPSAVLLYAVAFSCCFFVVEAPTLGVIVFLIIFVTTGAGLLVVKDYRRLFKAKSSQNRQ